MSGFSPAWLDLREPADSRARDAGLVASAREWLAAGQGNGEPPPVVVDLGSGTGATWRAFEPHSGETWLLVDNDPVLLMEAERRHGQGRYAYPTHLRTLEQDISDVAALPVAGARLVTASALFDLVSAGFLEAVLARLTASGPQAGSGFYAALNYDGTTAWVPAHPLDARVLEAFNADQRRDKGFGPALGPDAGAALERALQGAGFRVMTAASPWQLEGGQDGALMAALIDGIAGAAANTGTLEAAALADWRRFRLGHARTGSCTVGHLDVLALPELSAG